VRLNVRAHDGHTQLMSALRHAAYTDELLFVHAGIDPARPLSAQSDSFWWGSSGFASIVEPYGNYRRVVRGFDRKHEGFLETAHTVSLDAGCGFGGELAAACFAVDGTILHQISA
jgi:serine/threonine protein phosphatase 1